MEEFIRKALSKYNAIKAEVDLYRALHDKMPEHANNKELALLEMRQTVISGWVSILNDAEAFVITQHLINGASWHSVVAAYSQRARVSTVKSERDTKRCQVNALAKIGEFMEPHMDVIEALFADWLVEDDPKGEVV